MAEPISLAASILTLMGVINVTCQGVQRVLALKHAPKRLRGLYDRIEELKVALDLVLQTAVSSLPVGDSTALRFQALIDRANDTIKEADQLMRVWVKDPQSLDNPNQDVEVQKVRMLKDEKKLKSISSQLSDILASLHLAIDCISMREVAGIRITLQGVALGVEQLRQSDRYIESNHVPRITELREALESTHAVEDDGGASSRRTSIDESAISSRRASADEGATASRRASTEIDIATSLQRAIAKGSVYPLTASAHSQNGQESATHIPVDVAVTLDSLSDTCGCRCHSPVKVRTPDWVENAIGVLLVRWFKKPHECKRCSRGPCTVSNKQTLLARYYFPRWMMWRLIEVDSALTASKKVKFSLHAPRIIPDDSTIFTFTQHNNVEGVKRLFASQLASPYDVSVNGRTPLHFAATSVKFEMIEFLVKQKAKLHVEDKNLMSPSDIIWEIYLRNPAERKPILAAAGLSLSDTDSLDKLCPTGLHRIVLGLEDPDYGKLDLRAYLRISSSEIDEKDGHGKTALAWAASQKDTNTVRVLLDHKASVSVVDNRKKTPLHEAAGTGTAESVEFILKAIVSEEATSQIASRDLIEAGDDKARTPLNYATRMNLPLHTRILLDYGADVEARDTETGRTILLNAIYWGSYEVLPILLAHGASPDVHDFHRATILHYIARFGDLQTLRIMAEHDLGYIDASSVDESDLTAIDIFNSEDKRCNPEHGAERDMAIELFVKILKRAARGGVEEWRLVGEVDEDPPSPANENREPGAYSECNSPAWQRDDDNDDYFSARSSILLDPSSPA